MQIALRIMGRWLGWLLVGALWGALCGAIVGSCFGLIFVLVFYIVGQTPFLVSIVNLLGDALYYGAYLGVPEGAAVGAVAFAIVGLMRVWRASSQTGRELRPACRAAFWTSLAGAFYGALAGSLWSFVTRNPNPFLPGVWRASYGFIVGSQIGFCLGLALGALAPAWFEWVTGAMKSLLPRARDGQNDLQ